MPRRIAGRRGSRGAEHAYSRSLASTRAEAPYFAADDATLRIVDDHLPVIRRLFLQPGDTRKVGLRRQLLAVPGVVELLSDEPHAVQVAELASILVPGRVPGEIHRIRE